MFLQRALVTLLVGPLAIYLIRLGGWFYFLPIALVLMLATYEYGNIMRRMGWRAASWLLGPAVMAQALAAQFSGWRPYRGLLLAVAIFAVTLYALWLYERRLSDTAVADWLAMSGGILLLGWLGSHFFWLRGLDALGHWALLAMVANWSGDSGAYLFGRRFGRRRLSPRLSPNKTVEGYVGGIFLSAVFTLGIAAYVNFNLGYALGLVFLGAAISPAGDLAISLLKREAGVKDSGFLFPGHGGALDRIDSLLWAVTLAYYFALLVMPA